MDQLIREIQQLSPSRTLGGEDDTTLTKNLEDCLNTAKTIVSAAPIDSQSEPSKLESSKPSESTDLDLRLFQQWWKTARDKINQGEYVEAERLLETTLTRSAPYGSKFLVREETMHTLAVAYVRQCKWEDAANIIDKLETPKGKQASEAMHELSKAYLHKGDTAKAKLWCQRAISWREVTVGDSHILYYQSINLLSEIYEAEGQIMEAKGFKESLPTNFEGNSHWEVTNHRMPRNRESLQYGTKRSSETYVDELSQSASSRRVDREWR
jgi:tetratricopeptide (TPR) repeat protein